MATEIVNGNINGAVGAFWERFLELVMAPASEPDMLWFAIPLVIATFMITLYFGRYRREELGWNSAFGNTMVFLFVSIDLVRRMYESMEPHAWINIYSNPLYLTITVALAGFSIASMLVVYYHLLPKKLAFMVFANLPVNIAIYTVMTMVYVGVPADWDTLGAGVLLFTIVWLVLKTVQFLQQLSAKSHEESERGHWEKDENGEYELDQSEMKKGAEKTLDIKERVAKRRAKERAAEKEKEK